MPSGPVPADLEVDFRPEPSNVPASSVRFSWRMPTARGAHQTAYRLIVGRTRETIAAGEGDVWDSGRIPSSQSLDVAYDGPELATETTYVWAVKIWNEVGHATEFSEPSRFTTALGGRDAWGGRWIGHQPGAGDSNGYRSEWRLVDATGDAEWVQVDLGEIQDIETIELYPAGPFDTLRTPDGFPVAPIYSTADHDSPLEKRERAWGFGFPERYRIEIAEDAECDRPETTVDRTGEDQPNPGDEPVRLDVQARGRYVRVTAAEPSTFDPRRAAQLVGGSETPILGHSLVDPDRLDREAQSWCAFALSAIAIREEDGTDLARDRPITAGTSVEDDTWGRSRLVDGVYEPREAASSPLLRTEVNVSKSVTRARLHVATLGYGEVYLNGERVGEDRLSPAWTTYETRILYATYEVDDLLEVGENAIGLWLGRGFFSKSALIWTGHGSPRALLQLNVEYADGSTRDIVTDSSWEATSSPITTNDVYEGERYDARREMSGWTKPGFEAGDWANVAIMPDPGGELTPHRSPPIQITEMFEPAAIADRADTYVVDFGQNLTGWVELAIHEPDEGDEITIEHAEILEADGSLSQADLGDADATDTYVAKGETREVYEPRFTYHGFQFVEISGYPGDLTPADVTAKAVHTNLASRGSFDCANDDIRAVQHAAEWSLRGNSMGVPTDCPQRSERCGWTCDAYVSAPALFYNFEAARFYEKWVTDLADVQSRNGFVPDTAPFAHGTRPGDPSWTLAQLLIPWNLYQFEGDRSFLAARYDGMRRYVDAWHRMAVDGILPAEYGNYGDWLALEQQHDLEPRVGQPIDLFNTAAYYRMTDLLGRIASILDNDVDARRYEARAERIAETFNDRYLDEAAKMYEPGSQAANAIPLHYGIAPPRVDEAVAATLARRVREVDDGQLRTGWIGTPALIHALVDYGYEELAYRVLSQPERPGWTYMVNHAVTTTLWERWDSDEAIGGGMNSFNHQHRACVSAWFFEHLAGIQLDDGTPGPAHVTIRPLFVEQLDWVEAQLETRHGAIESAWERSGDRHELSVTIPWNTAAKTSVPIGQHGRGTIAVDDRLIWKGEQVDALPSGIKDVTGDGSRVSFELEAGRYRFERHHSG